MLPRLFPPRATFRERERDGWINLFILQRVLRGREARFKQVEKVWYLYIHLINVIKMNAGVRYTQVLFRESNAYRFHFSSKKK